MEEGGGHVAPSASRARLSTWRPKRYSEKAKYRDSCHTRAAFVRTLGVDCRLGNWAFLRAFWGMNPHPPAWIDADISRPGRRHPPETGAARRAVPARASTPGTARAGSTVPRGDPAGVAAWRTRFERAGRGLNGAGRRRGVLARLLVLRGRVPWRVPLRCLSE